MMKIKISIRRTSWFHASIMEKFKIDIRVESTEKLIKANRRNVPSSDLNQPISFKLQKYYTHTNGGLPLGIVYQSSGNLGS